MRSVLAAAIILRNCYHPLTVRALSPQRSCWALRQKASLCSPSLFCAIHRAMHMSGNNSDDANIVGADTIMAASNTTSMSEQINLFDLAAAAITSTITASRSILEIARPTRDAKNARFKADGSVVTDADFIAQGAICAALKTVHAGVRIVGEESEAEMLQHTSRQEEVAGGGGSHSSLQNYAHVVQRCKQEVLLRYHCQTAGVVVDEASLPLASLTTTTSSTSNPVDLAVPDDAVVDLQRVTVIVDPLDGTKSYTSGDYDSVSILIGIVVDNEPVFGVVGKPFGYRNMPVIRLDDDYGCVTFYGGPLIRGVFVAGGQQILAQKRAPSTPDVERSLPRAVISHSRSQGVVHDFCLYLGERGLIAKEPMLISGAGEKSLRLILQQENEALWFFPKGGTSLWDVAAPDALLRALGGRLTDKYGNNMDYSKDRAAAENVDGVIACIDAKLHAECIRLFQSGEWEANNANDRSEAAAPDA